MNKDRGDHFRVVGLKNLTNTNKHITVAKAYQWFTFM